MTAQPALKRAFGKTVRALRKQLGISQDELSWRAAVHRTYITNIERGICNPSLGSIAKVAEALGTTVGVMMAEVESALVKSEQYSVAGAAEIVLVEDDPTDAELAIAALKKAGLANTVHVLRDGAEALEYFFGDRKSGVRTPQPRLILLDLNLPKLSGLEVLQQLKADFRTESIPIVMLTVSRNDRHIAESKRLGADAYLVKPVNFRSLADLTPQLNLCWLLLQRPGRTAA